MSNKSIISNSSLNTLTNNKHTIPCRIDFIKTLLKGNTLEPLIDFDNTLTENFMTKNSDSENSHDTRKSLNKKLHNFSIIMTKIGGKLEYKKSGSTGHTFKGIIDINDEDKINYGVKVVAYPKKEKYGNIYDERRPENSELMMIKLLSYFVLKHQTPHIVLPIGTFNTDIKNFVGLVDEDIIEKEENHRYVEFISRYKKGYYHDTASILISEWANRGDLLDFMRKMYKKFTLVHWKSIFFQILSVLAVIQYKFPAFRHNDLKANNILVHKTEKKGKQTRYVIVDNTYSCPNIGYIVKLWDFDFACIPGIIDNSKVYSEWTKALNVVPEQNKYYDVHYFFNTLIKKGFLPQIMTEDNVPTEVKEFINRIVPEKYRNKCKYVSKNGRILIKDELTTPNDILMNDPFFESFRKPTVSNQTNDISVSQVLSGGAGIRTAAGTEVRVEAKVNKKKSRKTSDKVNKKSSKKTSRKGLKIKKTKMDINLDDINLEDLLDFK